MSRRAAVTLGAILAVYVSAILAHLKVALWLVQRRESDLLGSYRLADFLPHAGAVMLTGVLIWQARRAWSGHNRKTTLAGWAAWLAAAVLVDRFLIFSLPEYLHYPHYALLAFMVARLADPDRSALAVGPVLLVVTVLGIIDETLQYSWITISYSNYLDFNDFLLNQLGAAAGLLLYYGFSPDTRTTRIQAGARHGLLGFAWLGTVMLLIVATLQATSINPNLLTPIERQPSYNTWIPGPHAGRYYVLDPVTGTLILIGLGALASVVPAMRRRKNDPPPGPAYSALSP